MTFAAHKPVHSEPFLDVRSLTIAISAI